MAGVFSEGFQNHDEHFRVLEMMHRRLQAPPPKDTLQVCPECLMFSYFQPAMFGLAVKALRPIGVTSPFTLAILFRLFSALLGWVSLLAVVYCLPFWTSQKPVRTTALLVLSFLWFLPYLHARPSPESWAGSFFFLSLAVLHFIKEREGAAKGRQGLLWAELSVGALWALAFSSRYQMGISILFLALWYLILGRNRGTQSLWSFARMCLGFFLVAAAVEIINTWGYGFWYPTHWAYLDRLVFKGGVLHQFASGRWYYFIQVFLQGGAPFSILLLLGTFLGWVIFPRHVLTWITASFFLIHQVMAHKQINYLFPIAKGSVVLCVLSLSAVYERIKGNNHQHWILKLRPYAVMMNFGLLILACTISWSTSISLYKYLYSQHKPLSLLSVDGDCFEVAGYPITFYRFPGTEIKPINNYTELEALVSATSGVSWVSRKGFSLPDDAVNLKRWCQLTYSAFPEWVSRFNFNGWIERTRIWNIYQCQKPQS